MPRWCMQLGAQAIFVGSGIFKSDDPARTAAAIVKATARYQDASVVTAAARETGSPMRGIACAELQPEALLQARGA